METKTMDHNQTNVGNGIASLLISLVTGFIGWIGSYSTGDVIKYGSMALSGVAAVMAIVYWFYAIKDKRLDIKKKEKDIK